MSYNGKNILQIMKKAKNYNNFVVELLLKSIGDKNKKTLDFGSGYGFFANLLREKGVCNILCAEIDEELNENCKNLGFAVVQDLKNVDDDSFEFIYSLNVLEHIEDDKSTLLLLKNKLEKGGKLFLYVPAFQLLYSAFDKKLGHFRRYEKKDLVPFLQQNGFEIIQAKYADSVGFVLAFIYKLINKNDGEINMFSLIIFDRILFPIGRIFDKITFGKFFGKNLLVEARLKG